MTGHPLLGDINPSRYQRLFREATDSEFGLGLCDSEGYPVWVSDQRAAMDLAGVIGALNARGFEWPRADEGIRHTPITQDTMLWCRPLTLGNGELVGYLTALGLTGNNQKPAGPGQVLEDLGNCLSSEYRLQQELNDMAEELGLRYEELNLLYRLDDEIKQYDPRRGRKTLIKLVEDSGQYLQLDAVALVLPFEPLEVYYVQPSGGAAPASPGGHLNNIRQALFQTAQSERQAVVVNHPDDAPGTVGAVAARLRLMVCPVYDLKGAVMGMLVFARHTAKAEFSNSDRKLLEVLAEQASKVVQANQDPLTGLLNRQGFELRLEEALLAAPNPKSSQALIYLDLEQFKVLNDTLGHAAGDELLRQVAVIIRASVRGADTLARLGGDEFAVLVESCNAEQALAVARKLSHRVESFRFAWEGSHFDVHTSIGVVPLDGKIRNVSQTLSTADTACFVAKQSGKNGIHVYRPDDEVYARHQHDMQWVPRLRRAIDEDRFELFAQPIVPLQTDIGLRGHVEILLRLHDEQGKLVSPGVFIPAAERYDLIEEIDHWVVAKVMEQVGEFFRDAPDCGFRCAINLSGRSLANPDLLGFVTSEMRRHRVPHQAIAFEVTETAAISNLQNAQAFIQAMRQFGCDFALDDFGSGLSSFSYLAELPVNYIKIDGFFVISMNSNPVNHALVESINHIGQTMGLRTIAEFVETQDIRAALAELGVDYAQGFGIQKPLPLAELLENWPEVRLTVGGDVTDGPAGCPPRQEAGHG